jgi:hypothetical protein
MLYLCLATPPKKAWRDRAWRGPLLMLGVVAGALAGLAEFNAQHSGRRTVGSSWEGWNLYKGNSEHSLALYPLYSLDSLDAEGHVTAERPLRDEWDYNAYFRGEAVAFIKAHPETFLELALRKAWVFYGEVRATGIKRGQSRWAPAYVVQIPWMIAFRVVLWAAIGLAVLSLARGWRGEGREAWLGAVGFLGFLVLYSGFHVVGFAYERHVMPIVLPTLLYLLWRCAGRREARE